MASKLDKPAEPEEALPKNPNVGRMVVVIDKATKTILASQQDARPGVLLEEIIAAGRSADEIEEKSVTEKQFEALRPKPTWREKRREAYPDVATQLDMLWHDQVEGTTTWRDAIRAVKEQFPKPADA
ncbi:MAG TPA: hypothetical protein VD863_06905 [Bradyrhizobium sp.]|nr:hypothetical protein [Bradyrhizobium sp.]